jgi:hypothetical protein
MLVNEIFGHFDRSVGSIIITYKIRMEKSIHDEAMMKERIPLLMCFSHIIEKVKDDI